MEDRLGSSTLDNKYECSLNTLLSENSHICSVHAYTPNLHAVASALRTNIHPLTMESEKALAHDIILQLTGIQRYYINTRDADYEHRAAIFALPFSEALAAGSIPPMRKYICCRWTHSCVVLKSVDKRFTIVLFALSHSYVFLVADFCPKHILAQIQAQVAKMAT